MREFTPHMKLKHRMEEASIEQRSSQKRNIPIIFASTVYFQFVFFFTLLVRCVDCFVLFCCISTVFHRRVHFVSVAFSIRYKYLPIRYYARLKRAFTHQSADMMMFCLSFFMFLVLMSLLFASTTLSVEPASHGSPTARTPATRRFVMWAHVFS